MLLVIIKSTQFNCELKLPEENARRLAFNMVKYHKKDIINKAKKKYRGNKHKKQFYHSISADDSFTVEFKYLKD